MDLLDTHQHLILRDRIGYAWTRDIPELATGDFTLEDYHRLTMGKDIIDTVFMETGVDDADYQAEARMVAGMVGRGGMLGQIASIRPEEDAGFDDWLAQAKALKIVGFRRILHVVDDARSQTETFRRNLRKIGAAGFPFDLNFLARQLPIGLDLVRACPDQPYVLDHCGVPDVAAGAFDEWARGIDLLAPHENIVVKLSGITTYCAPGTASVDLVRPYVDYLLAAFGPDRMLWGGDWPVVNLGAGLPRWIDMTREVLADLSADERFAIGQGTARRVYGLG
jgi:predicted TIM-barrel fold metal-dependent hydrolase